MGVHVSVRVCVHVSKCKIPTEITQPMHVIHTLHCCAEVVGTPVCVNQAMICGRSQQLGRRISDFDVNLTLNIKSSNVYHQSCMYVWQYIGKCFEILVVAV